MLFDILDPTAAELGFKCNIETSIIFDKKRMRADAVTTADKGVDYALVDQILRSKLSPDAAAKLLETRTQRLSAKTPPKRPRQGRK